MCDAKTLYEAVGSGRTVDQKTIVSVLSQRNIGQVKAILVSYKQLYGHEFSKSMKQSKCGQFGIEVRIVVRCMQNPEKFFAKQLRMRNADAREILIRTVITRSEIDIKDINEAFAAKTGSSLQNLVRREFNNSKDKSNEIAAGILIGLVKRNWTAVEPIGPKTLYYKKEFVQWALQIFSIFGPIQIVLPYHMGLAAPIERDILV